jgi:hypothetical protein
MAVNRPAGDVEGNLALGSIVSLVCAFCLYRVRATGSTSRACMPVTTLNNLGEILLSSDLSAL